MHRVTASGRPIKQSGQSLTMRFLKLLALRRPKSKIALARCFFVKDEEERTRRILESPAQVFQKADKVRQTFTSSYPAFLRHPVASCVHALKTACNPLRPALAQPNFLSRLGTRKLSPGIKQRWTQERNQRRVAGAIGTVSSTALPGTDSSSSQLLPVSPIRDNAGKSTPVCMFKRNRQQGGVLELGWI